ncbi:PAS domain S-box protein [Clostridiaceae bacterium HSG29]|nr:PAS domain S-box protein [Clostridiaceae bacterium HSG29]
MKSKYKILFPILFFIIAFFLFLNINEDNKRNLIERVYIEEEIISEEILKTVDMYFKQLKYTLNFLASDEDIINFNSKKSEKILKNFYNSHKTELSGITRIDKNGRIIYTYPENNSVIGLDVSKQPHNAYVIKNQKPVVSEVFRTLQGYYAIAYAVPVFDGNSYDGELTSLITAENLSENFIINRANKNMQFKLISENGNILFDNELELIGSNINYVIETENYQNHQNVIGKMLNKESGRINYQTKENNKIIENYGVFQNIEIENTFWAIFVTTTDKIIYHDVESNSQKIAIALIILFILSMFIFIEIANNYISNKNRIEKEKIENKFEAIFNQSVDFIAILDLEGKVLRVNHLALEYADLKEEEVIGKYFWNTVWWSHSKELQEQIKQAIFDSLNGIFSNINVVHYSKEGEKNYFATVIKPVYDSNGKMLLLIPQGRNITEIINAENKLRELNENLEKRVDERVKENEKMQKYLMQNENKIILGNLVAGITETIINNIIKTIFLLKLSLIYPLYTKYILI